MKIASRVTKMQPSLTLAVSAKANKLKKPYRLHPGQTLETPAKPVKAYVVGPEDTLSAVSRRFAVSVEALREENDLSRNANLHPGQKLAVANIVSIAHCVLTREGDEVGQVVHWHYGILVGGDHPVGSRVINRRQVDLQRAESQHW